MAISCTHSVSSGDENNPDNIPVLGSLQLLMPEDVEAFFRITPQLPESKDSLFWITILVNFNKNTESYSNVRINLHGETSIDFPRKSIELKTEKKDLFFNNSNKTDEFFIVAMEEDIGYFRNYLSYSILKKLNLLYSHFEYIYVFINRLVA